MKLFKFDIRVLVIIILLLLTFWGFPHILLMFAMMISYIRKILAQKYPALSAMVSDEDTLALALNEEYVPTGEILPLRNGDTVALIPPISGG